MKNKLDKVMATLKGRRQQKEQVAGGEGPFNPKHHKQQHGEDPNSPNQYKPVKEAVSSSGTANSLGGRQGNKRMNIFYRLLPSQRTGWQHSGNQKSTGRYTEEELDIAKEKALKKFKKLKKESMGSERTDNLGRPDTGGSSETVTVNPKKPELTGQLK